MPNITIPEHYVRPLSKQDQINELNNEVRCKLAPSKIAGVGVIAIRNIQKGNKCYISPRFEPRFYNVPFSSFGGLLPEVKEIIMQRWGSVVNGSAFQSPNDDQHLLMFVNHSSDNYNYDVVSDTALRDIYAGEEILEDYRMMDNWKVAHPDLETWQTFVTPVKKSLWKKSLLVVWIAIKSIRNFVRS